MNFSMDVLVKVYTYSLDERHGLWSQEAILIVISMDDSLPTEQGLTV